MDEKSALRNRLNITVDQAQISALGHRPSNQDALDSAVQDGLICFVMSDGTGGHAGGEVASKLVVESILAQFVREASFGSRALRSYIDCAIVKVAQNKKQSEKRSNMSATVAALIIDQSNRCALWAHLGDTRIYFFRNGRLQSATSDHSLAQRFVDAGYAKADQLRTHPQRSVLYAAIGAEGDTFPEVTREAVQIQDQDAFLICTDGFWEWVLEAQMELALSASQSSEEWLTIMSTIAQANAFASGAARDNYSATTICLCEPVGGG
jgi:serine/threonine protein phosphatase PrpC